MGDRYYRHARIIRSLPAYRRRNVDDIDEITRSRFYSMYDWQTHPLNEDLRKELHKKPPNFNRILSLINDGADPNSQNNKNWTALMLATNFNKFSIVSKLLKAGADPNIQNTKGWTALMIASAIQKSLKSVISLLMAGTDPNIQTIRSGWTALMLAAKNNPKAVPILLDAGADPNIQNNVGGTALMLAAKYKPEVVPILLKTGSDPNIQNIEGKTVFDYMKRDNIRYSIFNKYVPISKLGEFPPEFKQEFKKIRQEAPEIGMWFAQHGREQVPPEVPPEVNAKAPRGYSYPELVREVQKYMFGSRRRSRRRKQNRSPKKRKRRGRRKSRKRKSN